MKTIRYMLHAKRYVKNMDHSFYMKKAIKLAKKGEGKTAPNPLVGALLVKDGQIVGSGYHKKAGLPHAEINALKKAGEKSKNSTLYVNLEPCSHFGRTPPCVSAIIENKISKVIIGTKDLNPNVNGDGIKMLKNAGIDVVVGVEENNCKKVNEVYFHNIKTGLPFVTAKVAISLDGKIAAKDESSKWISSSASRKYAHKLRRSCDSIMVGAGTIRQDNPSLDVRLGKKTEKRKIIIVSNSLDLPFDSKVFQDPKNVILITNNNDDQKIKGFEALGLNSVILPCTCCNQVHGGIQSCQSLLDPPANNSWREDDRQNLFSASPLKMVFRKLMEKNCTNILVEGGGVLLSSLLNQNLINKLVVFVAPIILGGNGKDFFPNVDVASLSSALHLRDVSIKRVEDEVMFEGYF